MEPSACWTHRVPGVNALDEFGVEEEPRCAPGLSSCAVQSGKRAVGTWSGLDAVSICREHRFTERGICANLWTDVLLARIVGVLI